MDPRFESCYKEWLQQQESDFDALLLSLEPLPTPPAALPVAATTDDHHLRALAARVMRHFEDYSLRRRSLLCHDPPAFFCPAWCSSFESSLLWLGGCRPTLVIRLLYSQSTAHIEATVQDMLNSVGGSSGEAQLPVGLVGLAPGQMEHIEALHRRTVREEERLEAGMAGIQEDVADRPMIRAMMMEGEEGKGRGAMEEYEVRLGRLVEEADELRVRTVKELVVEILTPRQAVEMLAAGKRLHLTVHAWGLDRQRQQQQQQQLLPAPAEAPLQPQPQPGV